MSEVTFSGNTIGDKAIYLNGVARGKKNEQERIIKLLEEKLAKMKLQEPYSDPEEYQLFYDALIALIKGEPNGETN